MFRDTFITHIDVAGKLFFTLGIGLNFIESFNIANINKYVLFVTGIVMLIYMCFKAINEYYKVKENRNNKTTKRK